MGHKSDTQRDTNRMPNPPYTILRGRVFYLNYRYPSDLVKAKLVAKSHAKFSLKTTSRSEAKAKDLITAVDFPWPTYSR